MEQILNNVKKYLAYSRMKPAIFQTFLETIGPHNENRTTFRIGTAYYHFKEGKD